MFDTIVVGTDGSGGAEEALRATVQVAQQQQGAEVHVVAAYHPLSRVELSDIAVQLPEEFRDVVTSHMAADTQLDVARSLLRAAGIEAEYHEVGGDPTEVLIDAAERYAADLLIVGSRGHGTVKRALLGSVSTKVVHNAPCTVMVVKEDN